MKHKKHKDKSKEERKKSRKKEKKKHKKQRCSESDSNSSTSEEEQEWVEKKCSLEEQQSASVSKRQEPSKREEWMDMKSIFPCVFNEKKGEASNSAKNADKPDLDKLGQSNRELNPYWKNGGTGLPEEKSIRTEQIMDAKWLRKSLQRAKEQAERENRSLEEIAAERWGSLEEIQAMISKAEGVPLRNKSKYRDQFEDTERYSRRDSYHPKHSNREDRHKRYDDSQYESHRKQKYKKPMEDESLNDSSYKSKYSGKKNWLKEKVSHRAEESKSTSNVSEAKTIPDDDNNDEESNEIKPLTEAEMNKLGAQIVKAEIMGNAELADKLKVQLKNAREVAKGGQSQGVDKVQNVILTRTDVKGNVRPLEPRAQSTDSRHTKRKNADSHAAGKKVRHYYDDDKYSLQQLFQKEKGRSTNEDDAEFVKVASKTMDMDEIFEERITRVKSDEKQNERDRSLAIKEHKRLTKSLDNCRWCVDSTYMLKHMIVSLDSEICLSLPQYTSLTDGHCVLTPVNHVACQLQLDENVWQSLKMFKQALYKMFTDRNQYPVFYEVYKSRYKFPHMQLECVPLPKEVGELAPIYFKKALLECETEWSMNKKIIDLENKDVRKAVPNGLSYFMVEFEVNKGYAHIIEDEQMFPKNFAEEILGGMLDLDHDMWRKPRKENLDQQREKVFKFSEIWKKYEQQAKSYD